MEPPYNTFVPIGRTRVDEFGYDAEIVEIMREAAKRKAAYASRQARIQASRQASRQARIHAWRQTRIDVFLAKSKPTSKLLI